MSSVHTSINTNSIPILYNSHKIFYGFFINNTNVFIYNNNAYLHIPRLLYSQCGLDFISKMVEKCLLENLLLHSKSGKVLEKTRKLFIIFGRTYFLLELLYHFLFIITVSNISACLCV